LRWWRSLRTSHSSRVRYQRNCSRRRRGYSACTSRWSLWTNTPGLFRRGTQRVCRRSSVLASAPKMAAPLAWRSGALPPQTPPTHHRASTWTCTSRARRSYPRSSSPSYPPALARLTDRRVGTTSQWSRRPRWLRAAQKSSAPASALASARVSVPASAQALSSDLGSAEASVEASAANLVPASGSRLAPKWASTSVSTLASTSVLTWDPPRVPALGDSSARLLVEAWACSMGPASAAV
jgi:hypothetical protein